MKQQGLFDEFDYNDYSDKLGQQQKKGSRTEIFTDYDSFVAKFSKEAPKTTDDCFTPPAVYQAVLDWLGTKVDLTGKDIIRPFYPGGDYQATEYTENSVVVDNPPFSILAQIIDFYIDNNIKFFLFAPYLTMFSYADRPVTMIVINGKIVYANGAEVNTGFITNLFPGIKAMTSLALSAAIEATKPPKHRMTKYNWPANIVRMSNLSMCLGRGAETTIYDHECIGLKQLGYLRNIGKGVYGGCLLVNDAVADRIAAAMSNPIGGGKKQPDVIDIELTPSEKEMIKRLNEIADEKDTTGF